MDREHVAYRLCMEIAMRALCHGYYDGYHDDVVFELNLRGVCYVLTYVLYQIHVPTQAHMWIYVCTVPSHTGSPTSYDQQQALVEYLDRQAKPRPSKTTNGKPKCLAFLSQEVEAAQTVPTAKLLFLNYFGLQGYTTDSQTVWPTHVHMCGVQCIQYICEYIHVHLCQILFKCSLTN